MTLNNDFPRRVSEKRSNKNLSRDTKTKSTSSRFILNTSPEVYFLFPRAAFSAASKPSFQYLGRQGIQTKLRQIDRALNRNPRGFLHIRGPGTPGCSLTHRGFFMHKGGMGLRRDAERCHAMQCITNMGLYFKLALWYEQFCLPRHQKPALPRSPMPGGSK